MAKMGYSTRGAGVGLLLTALFAPLSVHADTLRLADGDVREGRLIAAGPTRLVFDGPEGLTFHARSQVSAVLDADGRPHSLLASDVQKDPAGIVTTVDGAVRVRRRGEQLKVSVHGSLAVLRDEDELRTGPYGRLVFGLPGGGQAVASDDAIVRFTAAGPRLVDGKLRLIHDSGNVQAHMPEGRLMASEGRTEVQHLRGRSRVLCLSGRATFQATEGYSVELPRKHVLEVQSPRGGQPASLQASNTNAWPLRLEYGQRWISVQPGERVVLLGSLQGEAPREAPPPNLTQAPPRASSSAVARVVRATASFALSRRGGPATIYDRAEASGLDLAAGDVLEAERGDVYVEGSGAQLHLLAGSRVQVAPPEGGAPFKLLAGEALVTTGQQVSLATNNGALGLLRGEARVRLIEGLAHLSLTRGTAGARFGEDVRAELLAPAMLDVRRDGANTTISVPPMKSGRLQTVPLTLGQLDMQLEPNGSVVYSRVGERRVVNLANGASLQFMDPIRANVIPGPGGVDLLELVDDGRRVPLRKGTYRFKRVGKDVVAELPPGVKLDSPRPEATPSEPRPTDLARPRPEAGEKTHTLANGAVVVTRGWGELKVKRASKRDVVLEGLGGDLHVGPKVELTLTRRGDYAVLTTSDGRAVRHERGAGSTVVRLARDGRLRIAIDGRGARARSVDAEAGTEFDLTVRRDRYTLAFVFGQAVYLEPGQRMTVTQASGLRLHMAAERR